MKIKSNIKEIRDRLKINQQELAEQVGVSRQTIYFLEKGSYNPSLTISFKISEILNKPLNEIFYQEPIIRDLIKKKSVTIEELDNLPKKVGIDYETLKSLGNIDDEQLSKNFGKDILTKVALFLGKKYEELFED